MLKLFRELLSIIIRNLTMTSRPKFLFRAGLIISGVMVVVQAVCLALSPEAGQRVAVNSLFALVAVVLAVAASLYAARETRRRRPRLFPAWLVIAVSELFILTAAVIFLALALLPGGLP